MMTACSFTVSESNNFQFSANHHADSGHGYQIDTSSSSEVSRLIRGKASSTLIALHIE
jgi:hypothetical protein